MPRPRPQKTLADYMVIAVMPALIMLLVGSLVYFLLAVGYHGQFQDRLRWILGWFVLAIVLVARIAIEQGPEQARVYGLALAGATALVVFRFVDAPWIAVGLLAVVWWCANKLTWDSTLVDDSEDASGEGLLEHAGIDESGGAPQQTTPAAEPDGDDADEPDGGLSEQPTGTKRHGHAPGLWVVYFSLLALPLFGFGQLLIPAGDDAARSSSFRYLFVYVAAAMALLLTTSFLGLRRYLRQRRIQMPASITAGWLALGSAIIVGILALCILLPRPNAAYSATAWLDRIAEEQQEASRQAILKGEGAEGDGRRIGKGERPEDEQPQERQDEAGGAGERGAGQGERKPGDDQAGDQQQPGEGKAPDDQASGQGSGESDQARQDGGQSEQQGHSGRPSQQGERSGEQADDSRQGEQQSDQSETDSGQPPPDMRHEATPPSLSQMTAWLANAAKWLIYGALAAGVLWYVIRHRAALLESLRQFWHSLLALFGRQTAGEDAAVEAEAAAAAAPTPRSFASFKDPFASGSAARMKPETLVVYTFQALETWAREHGQPRGADETPLEFTSELAARFPELAAPLALAGRLYAHVAYATGPLSRDQAAELAGLWRSLTRPVREPVGRGDRHAPAE